jgi:hypothetical protein
MCAGGLFHYNKDSTTYGVARDAAPLFQDEDNNPLINEMASIYILDKLSLQSMQDYEVTAATDIDNYVFECTLLVDRTKIYRSSKELLAYIGMCVAFSPYFQSVLSVRTTGRTTHALPAPCQVVATAHKQCPAFSSESSYSKIFIS